MRILVIEDEISLNKTIIDNLNELVIKPILLKILKMENTLSALDIMI